MIRFIKKYSFLFLGMGLILGSWWFMGNNAAANHGGFEGYSHGYKGGLESKLFHKARFYLNRADEIGLTDEQVDKIMAIKLNAKKESIRRGADIEILKLDLFSALKEPKIDVPSVNKLIDQKYDIKKAGAKYMVQAFADMKSVLSQEQHDKVKALWKDKKNGEEEGSFKPEL